MRKEWITFELLSRTEVDLQSTVGKVYMANSYALTVLITLNNLFRENFSSDLVNKTKPGMHNVLDAQTSAG